MAYSDYVEQTWTDGAGGGTPVSAARLTYMEDGIFNAHYQPSVRVRRSSTQTINNATWTLLLWNLEDWDSAGGVASTMHDTSSNTGRLTARYAGKYLVQLGVSWQSNTSGMRVGIIQKNSEALPASPDIGVQQGGFAAPAPSAAVNAVISGSTIVDLAVNDYVAAICYQNSASNLTIGVDSFLAMTRVA